MGILKPQVEDLYSEYSYHGDYDKHDDILRDTGIIHACHFRSAQAYGGAGKGEAAVQDAEHLRVVRYFEGDVIPLGAGGIDFLSGPGLAELAPIQREKRAGD
jgi:hypothetical protein